MRSHLRIKVEETFHRALSLPVEERGAFLEANCPDPEVRHEVEDLLRFSENRDALPWILQEFTWREEEFPDATEDDPLELSPGTQLGDFRIDRRLGAGGMGVVYQARQVSLDRPVALKVLPSSLGLTPSAVERFRREALATARLHHTNVVAIYAEGRAKGLSFYAMELLDGDNLDRIIHQIRGGESNLFTSAMAEPGRTPDDSTSADQTPSARRAHFDSAARLFAEVADALQYAHEHGVIHRDVKPSNLMLTREGRLKVMDFGLARVLEQPGMTASGDFLGTPAYMSPEQIASGSAKVDHRTDIYSLGITLYEFLTLRRPFSGDTREQVISGILTREPCRPRRIDRQIPIDLETICLKAIEKDVTHRYQTAGALADDLRRYLNRFALAAKRTGLAGRAVKWARRRPAVTALAVCTVIAVVMAAVFVHRAGVADRERGVADRERVVAQRLHARDNALFAALGGNFDEAEDWIREAESLEMQRGWVSMLRGQVAFHRKEIPEALRLLKRAVKEMPESASSRGMLVVTLKYAGEWTKAIETLEGLGELELVTPEDYLFVGLAQSLLDPARGLMTVKEGIRRRNSTVGRLILAQIRVEHAMITGDAEVAEAAVEDATVAQKMLGVNLHALSNCALAHLVAARASRRLGMEARYEEHLGHCGRYVRALEPFREQGVHARAWYFELVGNHEAAMREWQRGAHGGNRSAAWRYAAALYERGDFREALELCDTYPSPYPLDVIRAYVLAEIDPALAREAYDELVRSLPETPDFYPAIMYPTIASLLGKPAEASRLASELRESIRMHPESEVWSRALLAYRCGSLSVEDLLNVPRSREQTCEAHFAVALANIAEGNRPAAKKHFRQALKTDLFDCFEYVWSRVFLERMENDSGWPRSIN